MPFDAAIIDPATHMAGWAPNDFWNQQMQKFVDAEVAKVQKSVDTNRRQGICPRSASEGALARKTNRYVTTTGEANDRVDAQRVNMPGRGELSAEFAERKRHNTSTTIDNSGFGGGLTSADWVSDMHRGQRDLSPEKIRALAPTAEERAEQRDRKLNFKFRAQFVLGNEKLDHSTTSKFPGPTAAQTIAAKPKREDALAKLVKTSKIAYMFDGSSPDEVNPARGEQRYTTAMREGSNPKQLRSPAQIRAEKDKARAMKAELTRNTVDVLDYDGQRAPSKTWRTTMDETGYIDPSKMADARGVMDPALKKALLSSRVKLDHPDSALGGRRVKRPPRFETTSQAAYVMDEGNGRDPIADKKAALELKKALQKVQYSIGWQEEYS